jgi:hypothetical protein
MPTRLVAFAWLASSPEKISAGKISSDPAPATVFTALATTTTIARNTSAHGGTEPIASRSASTARSMPRPTRNACAERVEMPSARPPRGPACSV